jgi:hypothetical protein
MVTTRVASFLAGMLVTNSSPHLATLITGRQHMTPLGGRTSGAALNGIWAALNLIGGLALLQLSRRRGGRRWDNDLPAFELGCLTFAAWMALSETFFPNASWKNHD